jgi:HK97 gp10 family phage protein
MPKTTVELKYSHFAAIAAKLPKATGKIVEQTAKEIEASAKTSMGPGGGKTYSRRGKTHTASAPGSPPAVDLGALRNSIQTRVSGTSGVVFTNIHYAIYLEMGTRKMGARPFMAPAAEKVRPNFIKKLSDLEGMLR